MIRLSRQVGTRHCQVYLQVKLFCSTLSCQNSRIKRHEGGGFVHFSPNGPRHTSNGVGNVSNLDWTVVEKMTCGGGDG